MPPPHPILQQTVASSVPSTLQINSALTSTRSTDSEMSQTVAAQVVGGDKRTTDGMTATKVSKRSVKDYIFGKVIGEGSFSTVFLAKDIHTGRQYAIKSYEKQQIIKERRTEQIRREKEAMHILNDSGSTLFTRLSCTFQDPRRLFFVMSYAKNSDMFNKIHLFDMACTRFYSAEILLALEHLHNQNIQHRDLKPENILLDENMHIKVTDFGCCKIIRPSIDRPNQLNVSGSRLSNTFVGSAHYVSPEVLSDKATSFSTDLWALGCIIYQMVAGFPPFRSTNEYYIFKKIIKLKFNYPNGFHREAEDLINKLLVLDPTKRLGIADAIRYTSIRSHSFYRTIDFNSLLVTRPPPVPSDVSKSESDYEVPDDLEPGLDNKQLTRLLINDPLGCCSLNSTTSSDPLARAAAAAAAAAAADTDSDAADGQSS